MTENEMNTIRSWLSGEDISLQALGAWLTGRLGSDAPELDALLDERLPKFNEVPQAFAKVAKARRASRNRPEVRRAALAALCDDENPFVSLEAIKALAIEDAPAAVAKAREKYRAPANTLQPHLGSFLRKHGAADGVAPVPIPNSLYKTLCEIASE